MEAGKHYTNKITWPGLIVYCIGFVALVIFHTKPLSNKKLNADVVKSGGQYAGFHTSAHGDCLKHQSNFNSEITSYGTYYSGQDSTAEPYKYSLLPAPRQVSFSGQLFLLNDKWSIQKQDGLSDSDPAVTSLLAGLQEHIPGLKIANPDKNSNSSPSIQLIVKEGIVSIGKTTDTGSTALSHQAYRLKLSASQIEISANAPAGLFYGVQTLLQLIKSQKEKVYLPQGEIVDWPDMEVRMIYWDDAHHLEHLSALKRAISQAAFFKINAFAIKLEGHFKYSSIKPVVEPYALTPAQYQELTDYAKAHCIELIPYLDAPAHVSFILKHPEYASLRAFPNSNYELSIINPATDTLLLRMFDELIAANKGSKYILLSTDEAYYVGKAKDDNEKAKALGGRGKLYAQFITRIANKLHKKGRTVIFWGEYPLTPMDIPALPSHLVNGVYDKDWAPKFKAHGIRQMIYTYTQGEEPLFPSYYPMPSGNDTVDAEKDRAFGRVEGIFKTIAAAVEEHNSDLMGVIIAGWGDAGLHPETFWLGYAAGAATGWNSQAAIANEMAARFYQSFYGQGTVHMDRVYQLLSRQAQFYDESWDWQASNLRTPIFGNSAEIYKTPKPARDQTLPMLPIPSSKDLSVQNNRRADNQHRLQSAQNMVKENNELINLLHQNLQEASYQHYNLEVLLSVALLCRQNLDMLMSLQHMDKLLAASSKLAQKNASEAISQIDTVLAEAETIRKQRNEVLKTVTAIWYKEWYPLVKESNGRRFLNQVDDVKDHRPGRTIDLSYLIYREIHYPLGMWAEEVRRSRNTFAANNHLPVPVMKKELQWEKLN